MNKFNLGVSSFLIVICWFWSSLSVAAFYKWTDEQGRTHYSQHPPSDSDYEVKSTDRISAERAEAARKKLDATVEQQKMHHDERIKNRQEREAKRSEDKALKEKCDELKRYLSGLERSPRVRLRDEQGALRMIPEEERQKEIQKTSAQIDKECKGD